MNGIFDQEDIDITQEARTATFSNTSSTSCPSPRPVADEWGVHWSELEISTAGREGAGRPLCTLVQAQRD